jgi:outer membrane protein TolC
VTQATRVYELTELRYTEGIATQLDVSDARLALQQARMNEANAYHDFYLALARAERALGVTLIDVR